MASIHQIPRFLLPRGPSLIRTRAPLLPLSAHRHASSRPIPPRPKTLRQQIQDKTPKIQQPDKYRPPSHGNRTSRSETANRSYGPKLTEEDKERMRTKKYPNMMSPEGSLSHWFLNNKGIHIWISMGILITLAIAAWFMDFMHKTVYRELLPEQKEYFRHPIASSQRFIEVYRMHVMYMSQQAEQQRLKKAEDVEKRKQFRLERIREAEERGEEYVEDPRYYVGEDGIRRRRVKRWFGIWE